MPPLSKASVKSIEAASDLRLPAVSAIDEWAAGAVGEPGSTERQHAGRMVRDVLTARGWRVRGPSPTRLKKPRLFTSGVVYVRAQAVVPPYPRHGPMPQHGPMMAIVTSAAGLSPGNRFCLALARRIAAPVLTADRTWSAAAQAVGVEVIQIRQ